MSSYLILSKNYILFKYPVILELVKMKNEMKNSQIDKARKYSIRVMKCGKKRKIS